MAIKERKRAVWLTEREWEAVDICVARIQQSVVGQPTTIEKIALPVLKRIREAVFPPSTMLDTLKAVSK